VLHGTTALNGLTVQPSTTTQAVPDINNANTEKETLS